MAKDGLNPKQAAFVREYLIDHNGTQAAIRAGYSKNGAEVTASKLLRITKVADAIAEAEAKLEAKSEWTREKLIETHARLASKAENAERIEAATKCHVEIGKLLGYYVEKREDSGNKTIEVVWKDGTDGQ